MSITNIQLNGQGKLNQDVISRLNRCLIRDKLSQKLEAAPTASELEQRGIVPHNYFQDPISSTKDRLLYKQTISRNLEEFYRNRASSTDLQSRHILLPQYQYFENERESTPSTASVVNRIFGGSETSSEDSPDEDEKKHLMEFKETQDPIAMAEQDTLNDIQKLQLSERANEIYREQAKSMEEHLSSMKSLIQDKENIIENLMLRYDLGILRRDQNRSGGNLASNEIPKQELTEKKSQMAERTILENFELREMVNELRDENFHLRNEIYELQDKINRQVLQINRLEKTAAQSQLTQNNGIAIPNIYEEEKAEVNINGDADDEEEQKYMDDEAIARRLERRQQNEDDSDREESPPTPNIFGICEMDSDYEEEDEDDQSVENNNKGYGASFKQSVNNMFASIFGIFSIFSTMYTLIYRCFITGYTLHCVGIMRPSKFKKSEYKLLDNIDTDPTFTTLITKLQPIDKVSDLKQIIKKTYGIDDAHDVLILFSHHFLTDNNATLESIGITNNSLLTSAISKFSKAIIAPPIQPEPVRARTPTPPPVIPYESDSETDSDYPDEVNAMFGMYEDYESDQEPVVDANELFGMFKGYISEPDSEPEEIKTPSPTPPPPTWPRLGFDVIMQENNVMVHKMPKCEHEMNKESLYHYALSTFSDSNNLYLKCPHPEPKNRPSGLCNARWEYNTITDILTYPEENDDIKTKSNKWSIPFMNKKKADNKWMDLAKLELLSSRNHIEDGCDVQKCPRCQTLYYKNYGENRTNLEDIKTIEDIENEFKFECIFCQAGNSEVTVKVPVKKEKKVVPIGVHIEDEIIEDIDGNQVNAMFADDNDSDIDSDDEDDEFAQYDEDDRDSIRAIIHMFDDDEPDFEDEIRDKPLNAFCFCCGDEWIDKHICDSTFKQDLVDILQAADKKKIGDVSDVPSIRCCPNCCQLIFHTDACKHMQCGGCKKDFCFVCLKPKLDGRWQCGSHCDKCPVADAQDMDSLPDTIVITKKSFNLY